MSRCRATKKETAFIIIALKSLDYYTQGGVRKAKEIKTSNEQGGELGIKSNQFWVMKHFPKHSECGRQKWIFKSKREWGKELKSNVRRFLPVGFGTSDSIHGVAVVCFRLIFNCIESHSIPWRSQWTIKRADGRRNNSSLRKWTKFEKLLIYARSGNYENIWITSERLAVRGQTESLLATERSRAGGKKGGGTASCIGSDA